MPIIFVGEFLNVALIRGTENVWIRGGGGNINIFRRFFLSHSAENFRRGILYCCIIFGYRKSLDEKRGVSRLSVESFLSHSADNFRRGILYCCSIFGYRKSLDEKRGVSRLSVDFFCLTVPKIFAGEPFCAVFQKISGSEKVYG